MKIVFIENCVEHSANFIIYKGDGDLSLQVIIGLCKHKEAAALKIKPLLQNGRADMSAIRRLFSFAVVRQLANRLFLFMRIIIKSKYYTNVRGAFDFDKKTG